MSKIDLTSKEWCELVFEGKNKKYGAYKLRQESTGRHVKALIAVLVLALLVFFLPSLISVVFTPKEEDRIIVTDVTELSNLEEPEEPEEVEEPVEPEYIPPPPEVIQTIKFTPPVITEQEVAPEEEMKTMEEVTTSEAVVGAQDQTEGLTANEADLDKLNEIVDAPPVENKPYDYVEQMPQFPGGDKEMLSFISQNLRYPAAAQENGIQGRVIVRFVISTTGEVTNVTIARSLDPICDKEAIRVIKMMPKWIPGKQNGNAVSVNYSVPVVFKLI